MKRTFLMVGLVALIGCGAEENEITTPATTSLSATAPISATASKSVTAPVSETAPGTETVAPRVDHFAPLPAAGLAPSSIKPLAWSSEARLLDREAGSEVRGHFDPAQVHVVEAARIRAQALGGVR